MKLTENFSLQELLESPTARRKGFNEQFEPPDEVVNNLRELCIHILQPLRDHVGPINISSGYRCPRLNKAVKGAKNSQHLTGEAADIQGVDGVSNKVLYDAIIELGLPFDQVIDEYNFAWVHVSYGPRNRRQNLQVK